MFDDTHRRRAGRSGTRSRRALLDCALLALALAEGVAARDRDEPAHRGETRDDDAPPAGAEALASDGALVLREELHELVIRVADASTPDEALHLDELVDVCQQVTGLNFTYTDATAVLLAQRRVRLLGPRRIAKARFYSFFQTLMLVHDFACIELGDGEDRLILVESLEGAARGPLPPQPRYVLPEELELYADQPAVLIRTIVTLEHVDARQATTTLRPLLPNALTDNVSAAGDSNTLILTGFGSNIAHLVRLLALVDEAAGRQAYEDPVYEHVPLEFASAEDVLPIVQSMAAAGRQERDRQRAAASSEARPASSGSIEILSDPRSNALIVMALPSEMAGVKELIARLDMPLAEPARNYHVYALEHVLAADVAEVLRSFLVDAGQVDVEGGTGGRADTGPSVARDDVVVAPDQRSNSLLIAAGRSRYEELVDLIRKLDRRQDQVLIETALIETTSKSLLSIGVELSGSEDLAGGGSGAFGLSNFGLSTLVPPSAEQPAGAAVPSLGDGLTAGILDGDTFALPVFVRMLEQRDDTKVLSVPSVLVNDNEQANIRSVEGRATTTVTPGVAGGAPQTSFHDYQDAGVTLSITPTISAADYLRLAIELEVSSFGASTGILPDRNERSISTAINVPDGSTMVIGGIVSDNHSEAESKLPLLGDLPLVGRLFRREAKNGFETTLYFFVTPHILDDEGFADLVEISYARKLRAAETIGISRMGIVDPDFAAALEAGSAGGLEAFELPLYRGADSGEVAPEEVGIDPGRFEALLREARPESEERGERH